MDLHGACTILMENNDEKEPALAMSVRAASRRGRGCQEQKENIILWQRLFCIVNVDNVHEAQRRVRGGTEARRYSYPFWKGAG